MADKRVLTVSQLNIYVKSLLESSSYLNEVYIIGEISNFTDHYKSGHLYMSLKDDTGVIKAVMFRQYASALKFKPENGMKIICKGKVSLYERDGAYQMYITNMQPQGMGELNIAYQQLKEKLQKEGLFDSDKKQPIPRLPSRIAVITSPTGAAVQDILNILTRRYPVAEVIMCPVQVQGDLAAPQLIEAIKNVNRRKCADVIIIGRGGGSIEDLWAFNNEELARSIAASRIPVISAVGHETDFTICDYAADLRAPTPSGAAELAVPDRNDLLLLIKRMSNANRNAVRSCYKNKCLILSAMTNKQCLKNPLYYVDNLSQTLDLFIRRMNNSYSEIISNKKQNFVETAARLSALSPLNVMLRGYSAVYKDGKIISSSHNITVGDDISIRFHDGIKNATIKD